MNSEIEDEDEFQAYVMEELALDVGEEYPKVRRIAGKTISPEIDLLFINRSTGKEETLTGYEFKFLNYKDNAVNFRRIYEGIGQAILYFQYGVDVSYLILGISRTKVSLEKEIPLRDKIEQLGKIMKYGLRCFGVKIWYERNPHRIKTCIEPEGKFSFYSFDDYKLIRQNLLSGNFNYEENFLKRCKEKYKKNVEELTQKVKLKPKYTLP